jgi:phosphoribosylaminoimidazole (AIR) synthetase
MLGIFNCGYGMVLITNEEIDIGDRIGRIVEITQYS